MSDDASSPPGDLAHQQAALAAALTAGATPPAGFDVAHVRRAAEMLLEKRAHSVARALPILPESLAHNFERAFRAYAAANPIPAGASPRDDALAFAGHLADRDLAPLPILRALAAADIRRGPPLQVRRSASLRCVLVSVRIPLVNPITFRVRYAPFPRKTR